MHRYTLCFFEYSFNGSVLVYVLLILIYLVLSANSVVFLDLILFLLLSCVSFATIVSSESLVMYQFVFDATDACILAYLDALIILIELLLLLGFLLPNYFNDHANYINSIRTR